MGVLTGTILTLFVLSSFFLIILVIFFQTKGGGMGGILGGGASQTAFGSSSGDILTKATRYTAIGFIALSLALSFLFAKKQETILPEKEGTIMPDSKAKTAPAESNKIKTDAPDRKSVV